MRSHPIIITFILTIIAQFPITSTQAASIEKYVRFEHKGKIQYGRLQQDTIEILEKGLFPLSKTTSKKVPLNSVKLLPPTDPRKVFAVGMNFASHLSSSAAGAPPMFLKLPTSLIGDKQTVILPADSTNVHFEGELVIIIGKRTKNVSIENARNYIFGVTVGNDLTERNWQGEDLQWLRAKASDGFGPVGPVLATGIDYNNVLLTTKLNGKIVQQENTRNMIHKPSKVVSYLSKYFTLEPGDMIFMGTPGRTRALNNGDVVSVEIEGVGLLTNPIKK